MNDEAAFVNHLAAHPDDGTARLAYADWLDEHERSIAAVWVREGGVRPPLETGFADGGAGDRDGDGSGIGAGKNTGDGDGRGNSYGFGCEYSGEGGNPGDGRGNGEGDGKGYGNGRGCGYGRTYGYGRGNGSNSDRTARPMELLITHAEVHTPALGEYVIVRSRDQGCVCGEYRNHHGREVALGKARQLFSWDERRQALIDFAVVPGPCRLSREAPGEVVMLEACGIIPTSVEVEAFLRSHLPEEVP